MNSIEQWLASIGLDQYARLLEQQAIDLDVLPDLAEGDLEALGIPLGDRKRFLRAIAELGAGAADARNTASIPAAPATKAAPEAERRQLTVMFCDLVGSTDLAARFDPEDVRDGIRRFQHCCDEAVRRFEGHVALYLGDGVLAYFGYPAAHEDDAGRAIRAALRVVERLRGQRVGAAALEVRIGIATGLVVVGDVIGEGSARQEAVTGTTPNLAARLQALAPAGGILVAARTHRIAAGAFLYEDIGRVVLKGLADPEHVWRIAGERPASSRFAAARTGTLSPFVGRDGEIEQLSAHWQSAKEGHGHVVWISGEPGIGKSRLLLALRERIAADRPATIECQCSPFHVDSALHPILDWIRATAAIADDEAIAGKLERLAALCAGRSADPLLGAELLAAALLLPLGERAPALRMNPARQKKETIALLAALILPPPEGRPTLAIVEDAHWMDPTTLDVLERVLESTASTRALVLVSSRAEMPPRWTRGGRAVQVPLQRLDPRDTAAMIAGVANDAPLPAETIARIVAKTDGVPLFAEELTKTVLESSSIAETAAAAESPVDIPATLRDSLMARLDRLGPVKEIAQIGAAIGREFDDVLIRSVVHGTDAELDRALARLTEAGLLFRRGEPPALSYAFKHALVQDAAYESLLKSRRLALHQAIAEAIERVLPQVEATEPEVLARHYTASALPQRALPYWLRAGRQARERSAYAEAKAHLNRGLELVRRLPASAELVGYEIDLLTNLGAVEQAVSGLASSATEAVFVRARELCEAADDSPRLFPVLWNLWLLTVQRGQIEASRRIAERLLATAATRGDPDLVMQAHHAAWPTDFYRADFASVVHAVDIGCSLYDAERHRLHRFVYGAHDPVPCGWIFKALALWFVGDYAAARTACASSIAAARELGHASTQGVAFAYAGALRYFDDDAPGVAAIAQELIELSTREGMPTWLSFGVIHRGWALAQGGDEGGLSLLREGFALKQRAGSTLLAPFHLGLLAQAQWRLGSPEDALRTLDEARVAAAANDERWIVPELWRLRGEFLAGIPDDRCAESEPALQRALAEARGMKAKAIELRTTLSLARLRRGDRRDDGIHASLAALLAHWGADEAASDVRAARALLEERFP